MNRSGPFIPTLWMLIHKTYTKIVFGTVVALGTITLSSVPALGSETIDFSSTTGEYPVTANTTVKNMTVLEDGEDTISCGKVEYSGELTKGSEALTLTPSYSECTGDIEGAKASATITTGSCKIELSKYQEGEEKEGEVSDVTGDEAIGPSGCGPIKMEDSTSKCTFEVSSQGPASGTTDTPNGETMEITSKLSDASLTYTGGCTKPCPKMKLAHPVVWIIVHGVWRLYQEIVSLQLSFFFGGKELKAGVTQQFNPNENVIVEIKNPYLHWGIYEKEMLHENVNWTFTTKAGEPGTIRVCYRLFYFPGGSCRFELKAPATKGEKDNIEIRGAFFSRGIRRVEVV